MNEKSFLKHYYEEMIEKYKVTDKNNLFEVIFKNVTSCPFCNTNYGFTLSHNYSEKKSTDIFIYLSCRNCHKNLITKWISGSSMFDAHYVYNEKIKILLDSYIENYPNEELKFEIEMEFHNTEKIGWLCC